MDRAGEKLKRVRERLKMTYRDVVEASQKIAEQRGNDDFSIALSRLSDIENKGIVPTIYRTYTLCAVYRLNLREVLGWYGVPADSLATSAAAVSLDATHPVLFEDEEAGEVPFPRLFDRKLDLSMTTFLSSMIQSWGKLPLALLNAMDTRHYRYGFIGLQDWSMYPLLQPGSLVLIAENRRKIVNNGWTNEFERPIYFLEHRGGYICGWCTLEGDQLVVQPHPASHCSPSVYRYPAEIELIGQVSGVAMLLQPRQRRLPQPAGAPAKTPGL